MNEQKQATVKPCSDCVHFDTADGMCCRKFVVADILVHRSPPMRGILWSGEDLCGKEGRWFEPTDAC